MGVIISCKICGAPIERKGANQKYCESCADEVIKSRLRTRYLEQKNALPPGTNSIDALTKEARQKGISYGKLQALKYMERMQG